MPLEWHSALFSVAFRSPRFHLMLLKTTSCPQVGGQFGETFPRPKRRGDGPGHTVLTENLRHGAELFGCSQPVPAAPSPLPLPAVQNVKDPRVPVPPNMPGLVFCG